jgi:hypothetical protein
MLPNSQDNAQSIEASDTDPVANYVYVGEDIADGLVVWITVSINTSAFYDVAPAAFLTADSGVEDSVQHIAGHGK